MTQQPHLLVSYSERTRDRTVDSKSVFDFVSFLHCKNLRMRNLVITWACHFPLLLQSQELVPNRLTVPKVCSGLATPGEKSSTHLNNANYRPILQQTKSQQRRIALTKTLSKYALLTPQKAQDENISESVVVCCLILEKLALL
jgi:hypothetical protein